MKIRAKYIPEAIHSEAKVLEDKLSRDQSVRNLWNRSGYWSSREEKYGNMGWLWLPFDLPLKRYEKFGSKIKENFDWIVLIGIGGAVQALRAYLKMFGFQENSEGFWTKQKMPTFFILDTTCSKTIKKIENKIDLDRSFFIYSSKAGGAPESAAVFKYFFKKSSPEKFLVITDPSLPLDRKAKKMGIQVFHSRLDVPGRMNPLSMEMLVPCAIAGIPIRDILADCRKYLLPNLQSNKNIATKLASLLEALRINGMDKLTLITSEKCKGIPFWLDQLFHENLGKDCKGFLTIYEEPVGLSSEYGNDRFFLTLSLRKEWNKLKSAKDLRFPLIDIRIYSQKEIGKFYFLFQFVSFLCAELMKVNPLKVSGVALSKEKTKNLIKYPKLKGENEISFLNVVANFDGIVCSGFLTQKEWKEVAEAKLSWKIFPTVIQSLKKVHKIQFIALLPYIDKNKDSWKFFTDARTLIRKKTRLATYLGFGPGWQHSALQYFQEGANKGLFFIVDKMPGLNLKIPEIELTFDEFIRAQAYSAKKSLSLGKRPVLHLTMQNESKNSYNVLKKIIIKSIEGISESNWH